MRSNRRPRRRLPSRPSFAGGTHVSRTGDIGLISIVSEGAVAAGVRRIEAKTATEARHHLNEQAHRLHDLASLLKAPEDELNQRLASLLDERRSSNAN